MIALQFGAGNIGRGFMGQLFYESGYETIFVDVNKTVVSELNKRKSYTLRIVGENPKEIIIRSVSAIDGTDIETVADVFSRADIIATAVGVSVLEKISPFLAKGIEERYEKNHEKLVNIIICENLLHAGTILKEYIRKYLNSKYFHYLEEKIGFVETVIGRMIPVLPEEIKQKDPLLILSEEFGILPVAKEQFKGEIPEIKNMVPSENFLAYEEQKLFIHNLGHSISAYLGYLKKYQYIWQAISDSEIRETVKKAVNESGSALMKKHNLDKIELDNYIEDLLKRFANRQLSDTVYRVGRDPLRKLGPDDRLIGAANLCLKYGIIPENIIKGIIAAFNYDYSEDEQAVKLSKLVKEKGIQYILREICKVEPEGYIWRKINESSSL